MGRPVRTSTIVGVVSAVVFGGSLATLPERSAETTQTAGSESASAATTRRSASATTKKSSSSAVASSTRGAEFQIPAGTSDEDRAAYLALASLAIKGRAPKTGYNRDLFGQRWTDDVTVEAGHNGCDTRNDILRRDLDDIVIKFNSNGCTVQTGLLMDPLTGEAIDFVRGETTSDAVQVDHVVSLSDAWQKGAQQWAPDKKQNFANDPRNLLAVDGPTNQSKSDGDAASWLPPNKAFRCTMITMQINVKVEYDLWVTQAEHDAMKRVLDSCDGKDLPGPVPPLMREREEAPPAPPPPPPAPEPQAEPERKLPPVYAPEPAPTGGVIYDTCGDAKRAGAGPFYRGGPGYTSSQDSDGDGVACEAN